MHLSDWAGAKENVSTLYDEILNLVPQGKIIVAEYLLNGLIERAEDAGTYFENARIAGFDGDENDAKIFCYNNHIS